MTTGTTVDIGTLIYSKPELHRGQPCLAGTGMTVKAVAIYHKIHNLSAEEILEQFPHLDLARVYAALAYYFANTEEIEFEMEEDERAYDEWEAWETARLQAAAAPK